MAVTFHWKGAVLKLRNNHKTEKPFAYAMSILFITKLKYILVLSKW